MERQPVVMVVEDDREMNRLQQELLETYGLGSVPAYDGKEALEVCRESHADAVILDLMLPKMDGLECCKKLRECHTALPIVIVTALDSPECRDESMEAGADAYFCKPFDPDEVVAAIQRLLARACEDPSAIPGR
jgi:DNA-binding response OmpR family regulator